MRLNFLLLAVAFAISNCLFANSAQALKCESGEFGAWLAEAKKDAAAKGVGARGLAALDGLTLDSTVIKADRSQGVFSQTFEQFSGRMIPPRLTKGRIMMGQHVGLLQRIDTQYGVPGAMVIAIWGLETSYGAVQGNFSTLRSIASLAYDCRRTDRFQAELLDALRLVDSGDINAATTRGAWAGEIGQTQFMASSYMKYAVDYDGDGRRDLVKSVPDVLASTANYLKGNGWTRGAGWEPGQPNFAAIQEWNKSVTYARTIAAFATQLSGR